ncbi:MAG: hypothetical protein ACP5GA_02010 [Acidithiobacillus sp.]
MKRYLVGGAVRDRLRGAAVQDRDYVLVDARPEDIDALLAQGFRWAGKDFPVLIGRNGEELALARTERKSGSGHRGFVVATAGVSLEDDLLRRDLTINAMAEDLETGAIIDPYGGRRDLDEGVLRHVSPAFREDPLRVLRLARFAARLGNFIIAPETEALVRQMVAKGELAELSPDRIWKETEKALASPGASRYFSLLWHWGALNILFPELLLLAQSGLPWQRALAALDHCLRRCESGALAWAALCYPLGTLCPATAEAMLTATGSGCPSPNTGSALRWRWSRAVSGCCRPCDRPRRDHGCNFSCSLEHCGRAACLVRCCRYGRPLPKQRWSIVASGHWPCPLRKQRSGNCKHCAAALPMRISPRATPGRTLAAPCAFCNCAPWRHCKGNIASNSEMVARRCARRGRPPVARVFLKGRQWV